MQASYRLPHRVKDGYGLKKYFIDELAELSVDLIVTVDCGTRDIDVVKYAKQKGIDIIVTDHHAVPDEIPKEAVAIINPKRDDCNYLYKNLA
jgi:single-stranded-DNA-specific exonuclease